MAISRTTELASGLQIYYDKRFLKRAMPILVHYQMAQKGRTLGLPGGEGQTVYWTRYLPIAKRTTALTETITGGIATAKAIKDMRVSTTVELYGDYAHIHRLISLIHIDKGISEKVNIVGTQMGESMDYLVMDAIHGGDHATNRIRIDNDSAYTVEGTDDGGGSTTVVADDTGGLVTTDNMFIGGYVICTDPLSKAYGEVRLISDSTSASGEVLVGTVFSESMASKKYRVVASNALASTTDNMSTAGVRYAVRELKRKKALKFEGGGYTAILPIDCEYDFMGDSTWTHVGEYQDKTRLMEGEIGKWMGVRFVTGTVEGDWREVVGDSTAVTTMGTYSATGTIYTIPFFGAEAVGVVDLLPQPKKIYVRSWEQLGQEIPFYSSVGWEVGFATKVLNGNFAVGLMCAATV